MNETPWKVPGKWHTSHWNFCDAAKAMYHFPEKVTFHDVTLRDGEQQAGVAFSMEQKVMIAEKLAAAGIQRIETGMPATSRVDYEAIKEMVRRKLPSDLFIFSRCMVSDVDLALELGVKGIILETPANEELIHYGYQWESQKAIENAISATNKAHENGLFVVLFLIDFSRADFGFLTNFIDQVNERGYFDALACVDTNGTLNPIGTYHLVKTIKERYPDKQIEFHGHDDFGMGAANSCMAVAAGASVIHTTIGALGERAGNAPYEDVDMALLTMFGIDTGIHHEHIWPISQYVSSITGAYPRPNKGVTGKNISVVESGLVLGWYDRIRKIDPQIMYPYDYHLTGHPDVTYVLGKYSGLPSIDWALGQLGMTCDDKKLKLAMLTAIKEYAISKGDWLELYEVKEVFDKFLH